MPELHARFRVSSFMETPPPSGLRRIGYWVYELDRILRGEATNVAQLSQGTIRVPAVGLTFVLIVLAAIYGLCVGWFALFNRTDGAGYQQMLASTAKMPMLFFFTLLVTFPSLYVFNALVGSKLRLGSLLKLMLAAMGVILAVAASFGPIIAFFSVTTTSYHFMGLLNVVMCGVAGLLGLKFLMRTLHRLTLVLRGPEEDLPAPPTLPPFIEPIETDAPPTAPPTAPQHPIVAHRTPPKPGPLERLPDEMLGRHTTAVFRCWVVIFALVGAQMSWVLRPFIGDPNMPFSFFRERESNFFAAVWQSIRYLFGF